MLEGVMICIKVLKIMLDGWIYDNKKPLKNSLKLLFRMRMAQDQSVLFHYAMMTRVEWMTLVQTISATMVVKQ